ncbi:MAG: NAD-dependent epimerase/dehydratase family protein [Candidatus Solibacter sp.]|nr:NAD-dependent epimerase/dehydratase family protein [Candidatus Solibacter sp.]
MTYRSMYGACDFHPATRDFFRGKTVAVTGGTGFIGSHLVEQLLALGARCIVLSRTGGPGFLTDVTDGVELRTCDLESLSQTREGIRGASIVLNLAATVAGLEYNFAHPASIFAQEAGVERFLVTGSACVYPRFCSLPTPEEEGFVGEPEPTNSGYGWAKRMQEYLGAQYAKEFGLAVAIARPYNGYGPRDDFDPSTSHVIPALIRKAFETPSGHFDVWGDGSHSRSFLYVDDFARGLVEIAARYAVADVVNLGADEEITIGEVAREVGRLVSDARGVKVEPQFQPAGLTGQPRRRCDTSKAMRELGFQSRVPFRDGLRRMVDWYAEHAHYPLSSHSQ